MASYAALSSLSQTIDWLRNSFHRISILNSSSDILAPAYTETLYFQNFLFYLDYNTNSSWQYWVGASDDATIGPHFSSHFPSEYQILQFSDNHLRPLHAFLTDSIMRPSMTDVGVDGLLIREAVHRLGDVVQVLGSTFPDSHMFLVQMEEEINSLRETLTEINEHYEIEDEEEELNGPLPLQFLRTISLKLLEFEIYGNKVLEEFLQKLRRYRSSTSSDRLNALDGQIREAASRLEDVVESEFTLKSRESHPSSLISLDLHEVNSDIDSFTQSMKKLKEKYFDELFDGCKKDGYEYDYNHDGDDDDVNLGIYPKMIGYYDEFCKIRDDLTTSDSTLISVTVLIGMAGIGKTTLATKLFEDPSIKSRFDRRVWVNVGSTFQLEKIRLYIIAQMELHNNHKLLSEGDEKLNGSLKGKTYLVVLDDVWEKDVNSFLEKILPIYDGVGIRVLLTTRLSPRTCLGRIDEIRFHNMRFLDKDESWDLLRDKVFVDQEYYSCPPQLEKAGKKISENCDGLPLTIVTVANLLIEAGKNTAEDWDKLADKENSIFADAYDRMSNVLRPSYNFLPKYMEACFLYLGVFPQNHEITRARLNELWIAEGFLHRNQSAHLEDLETIIYDLDGNNLLLTHQRRFNYDMKTCSLHSSFWHLSRREASKNKFYHVIKSKRDGLSQAMKSQRRLCIHNTSIFGIKDVHESIASVSTARSLLCSDPPHQYPVPICFGHLRLLRVVDALAVRFYEFPMEVVRLVLLRYLALTCYGDLPRSISELWNLQFLIVRQHTSIISSSRSYLPKEIWDMEKLKHLQIMESDLPDPCGALLPNLVTLLHASPHSCTKSILEGLPNLTKLGIRIESIPDNSDEPLICFDHISHLDKLESLKCIVVNPKLGPEPINTLLHAIFPTSLIKLSLSGFGYPWEDMRVIASLPNLEVLKLRCYAFRGPKWVTGDGDFPVLRFLLIEDTDLVQWTDTGIQSCPCLELLRFKHCYKLEEIPQVIGDYALRSIELDYCNPLAVTCANRRTEDQLTEVVARHLGS